MMKDTKKADFKNLLSKMSVQKEKDVPIQKVIPVKEADENNSDKVKISLSLYVEDWLDITRFRNFKVLELKKLEYTISDAILYGLSLLEDKYDIKRNRDKITLKRGRRGNERAVKITSVDLPKDQLDFINDFLYHKVFVKNQLDFTRPEMFAEMVGLIRANNAEIFNNE